MFEKCFFTNDSKFNLEATAMQCEMKTSHDVMMDRIFMFYLHCVCSKFYPTGCLVFGMKRVHGKSCLFMLFCTDSS